MRAAAPFLVVIAVVVSACGDDAQPTLLQPSSVQGSSPPVAVSIPLNLKADSGEARIDFGSVQVGQEVYKTFQICNESAAPITVQGMLRPDGFSAYWDYEYWGDTIPKGECTDGYSSFVPRRVGRYEGSIVVTATPAAASGAIAVRGTATAPPGPPLTIFGEGTYVVGLVVAPGRYHADPNSQCEWRRSSTYPIQYDTSIIATITTWIDPGHWIVDILPSDAAFESYDGCGWWDQWPGKKLSSGTISHGVWEVNRHVQPGRYQAESGPSCRWERLRHFRWTPDGVIETRTTESARTETVTLQPSDAGFLTTPECGVWKRIS